MSLTTLIDNGASDNRVDIIFMGDGYTADDTDTYLSHVTGFADYLFSDSVLTDPFHQYQNFFNVHFITTLSNESGVDDPSNDIIRDTALGARYRWDGITERLLYIDSRATNTAMDDALMDTDIAPEMRLVSTNSDKYGGGGGYFAVYAGGNASAYEIALHELGHSFAGLADEYSSGGPTAYSGSEPNAPNSSMDSTGEKWAHWLGFVDPSVGEVGTYEGSSYSETGVYRPTAASKMRALNKAFDPIAKEAFILEFYSYVDPLDDWTDRDGLMSLLDPLNLSVTPIDPDVIDLEWSIDGTVVAGDMLSFAPADYGLHAGTYTISARAFDNTGLVRRDLDEIEQIVSWAVTLSTALPPLYGRARDDVLVGTRAAEDILGRAGDDWIETGGGADIALGGSGIDTISFAWAESAVIVDLKAGRATLDGDTATIWGFEIVQGTSLADDIAGNSNANTLNGFGGDDRLSSGGGDGTLDGGTGNDFLLGADGAELILGGLGNDTVQGRAGDDRLHGGAGEDQLFGGAGADRLFGNGRDDILRGGDGADALFGGEGNDSLHGGNGVDSLYGDAGGDVLFGGAQADWLYGGRGNDTLTGGMDGQGGDGAADTFVFAPFTGGGGGIDRITDFETGLDQIDLTRFSVRDFLSQVKANASDTQAGLRIDMGNGDILFVETLSLAEFTSEDVLL